MLITFSTENFTNSSYNNKATSLKGKSNVSTRRQTPWPTRASTNAHLTGVCANHTGKERTPNNIATKQINYLLIVLSILFVYKSYPMYHPWYWLLRDNSTVVYCHQKNWYTYSGGPLGPRNVFVVHTYIYIYTYSYTTLLRQGWGSGISCGDTNIESRDTNAHISWCIYI